VAVTLSLLGCETAYGNNLKPVGMSRDGSSYTVFVPLCPGELLTAVSVDGAGYEWYVSDPAHPQETKIVIGDNSAFRQVEKDTIPATGLTDGLSGSDPVLVSVDTSMNTNQRFRFQNGFHVKALGPSLNGGEAFDYKDVTRASLEKASNCPK
jgi:hypothetical protein